MTPEDDNQAIGMGKEDLENLTRADSCKHHSVRQATPVSHEDGYQQLNSSPFARGRRLQADEVLLCLSQAAMSNLHSGDPKITGRHQEPPPTLGVFQLSSSSVHTETLGREQSVLLLEFPAD